ASGWSGRSGAAAAAAEASAGGAYVDLRVAPAHHLAGADLGGLAQFHGTVHQHFAAGDDGLAHAAAAAQSGQAQQVVERDEVAVEFEIDLVHAVSLAGEGGRGWLASQRSRALPKAWRSRAWKPA